LRQRQLRFLRAMPVRLGLRGKMLAFTFGIVVLLVGLSLAVIHQRVARQLQAGIAEQLAKTRSVFERFMDARASWVSTERAVASAPVRDGERPLGTLTVGFVEPVASGGLQDALKMAATSDALRQALVSRINSDLTAVIRAIERDLGADLVGVTDAAGVGRGLS